MSIHTIMETFLYAAYGSNLHPARLQAAERCPSAHFLGRAVLPGYSIHFRMRGIDESAKCDLAPSPDPTAVVHLAVYEIPRSEEPALDLVERGYQAEQILLFLHGQECLAKIYVARAERLTDDLPFDWYREWVTLGARFQGFPAEYIAAIAAAPSREDPDPVRAQRNWASIHVLQENQDAALPAREVE
ncbi:MAG: gamma-glutamylcyclotransferase [Candidatus Omnitrophica bacterium]|nr:gamma-glutamylcyclotransferase [Candidatus Omnitrophota bacterium]